ncbi:hypothetical protein FT643_00755 [Ketobacter sp. MCCC 1A13808]|uniref:ribonuclease D n=1 Tax=Ketobacter sp. MCCC 1A13808 TaxID=2602738 RepID=UPI0012EB2989|nr:HRDC domain-containing protein [Ketobacter sp. MCCC 1A13808]MVF10659.1 hypothetical protein [Ketobacter sp. MCCC 1A13808]
MNVQWIDSHTLVLKLCEQLQGQSRLAVDTEFVRTNTYFSQPGLIQVATDSTIYLIDPTGLRRADIAPLGDRLFAADVQLLMHSAGEDLDVFRGLWNRLPVNLFDTQIAASFVGFDRQSGLQRLLKNALDIDLAKEETRSDWLKRPLSESQLHYAAEDVRYLHKLADVLEDKLITLDRMDWFQQESRALITRYENRPADDQLYLGFGAGWKLKPQQQAALRYLAGWRERTAREINTPKTFIAKDANLYGLVENRPKSKGQLAEIGLQSSQIRKYGDQLIEQVEIGYQQPIPDPLIPRPLSKSQQRFYKELRKVVSDQAEKLQIPADLLSSKANLVDYLLSRGTSAASPYAGGWREQAVQPCLDAYCESSDHEANQHEDSAAHD